VVQSTVLETIDSRQLAVYAVWEPILRSDDERSSRRATTLFPDARVKNYWAGTQDLGKAFQSPIELKTEPAWDVYLVYPPGTTWNEGVPPRPELFQHQLAGRLPDSQRLDGPALAEEVQRILAR